MGMNKEDYFFVAITISHGGSSGGGSNGGGSNVGGLNGDGVG